jgi:excisionase family DNA binding protein
MQGLLTADELAARWGIDRRTLQRWMSSGRIPGAGQPIQYMSIGRKIRFSPAQVAEMEAGMTITARPRRRRKKASVEAADSSAA